MGNKKKNIKEVPVTGKEPPLNDVINADLECSVQKVAGLKLNIGSGTDRFEGFINVDLYNPYAQAPWDAAKLPLNNDTVAMIITSETVEHFGYHDLFPIFKEWFRVLAPGGEIHITTPDIYASFELALKDKDGLMGLARVFGSQCHGGQFHKWGLTIKQLNELILMVGFKRSYAGIFDTTDGAKYIYFRATK